jgi:prolyl-tRNA synthetase
MAKLITPRGEDYARWYTDVCIQARLADYSPVKGCMVIRPHGYGLWENMQKILDGMFKATGHENAYFPLFIPKSFLAKEAEHVEGFAKECAIVTHTRLKTAEVDGKLTLIPDPDSKLEEELIVRPTSETIIYSMFAKWVQSYRDLPILINQWANVVRWEMRTRLFLRTTEFLWQEGHTVHATEAEAEEEARKMLDVYATFAEDHLAIPVLRGVKTEREKFAGAERTYSIEALMQDNKGLQAATSHHLGQNFSRAFGVKYQDEDGKWEHCWSTSWGMSTRMIGAVIMAHGDDNGLVLPPRVAPIQCVIIPIWRGKDPHDEIVAAAHQLRDRLVKIGLNVKVDDRDNVNPGFKYNEWEMLGVPLRLELGPRDLENKSVMTVKRIGRVKAPVPLDEVETRIPALLEELQQAMFDAALKRREEATHTVDDYDEFKRLNKDPGGFLLAHWCGGEACEEKVQEDTKATIRCLAFDQPEESGKCLVCGGESKKRAHFAKSY